MYHYTCCILMIHCIDSQLSPARRRVYIHANRASFPGISKNRPMLTLRIINVWQTILVKSNHMSFCNQCMNNDSH